MRKGKTIKLIELTAESFQGTLTQSSTNYHINLNLSPDYS